ncbi:MAG: hypothetical protein JO303_16760 [Caulobacteraceae bacterium]|nr:hypothetical protein [Caulobacteraceae bacterium]
MAFREEFRPKTQRSLTWMGAPSVGPGLRPVQGVLRAPFATRFAPRMSEVLAASNRREPGSVARALIEGPALDGREREIDLAAADVVRLRIGGDFWAPRPNLEAGADLVVVKADSRLAAERGLALALDQASPERIIAWLPRRPWASRLGGDFARKGGRVLTGPADPWVVLDRVQAAAVAGDDDFGVLALLAGKAVHVVSPGALGGWGLAQDHPSIARRGERSLPQLAAAALIDGVRYFDPFSGRPIDYAAAIRQLGDWRRLVDQDRDLACLAGVAWWKRARVRRFLAPGVRQAPNFKQAGPCIARAKAAAGAVALWPSRAPAGLAEQARAAGVAIRRIEDGFVRSVGLGSDLLPPSSIVIDRRGIYYDAREPSDLEAILAEADFPPELQTRALALVARLRALGMTKYNLAGAGFQRPAAGRVVLVPGQVEDDQSVRLGGGEVKGNLDLVRRVRTFEPDAFLIYKPHPDVEAGNRVGAVPDAEVLAHADRIERQASMPALLDGVDAVHVLTSLTGFEALLRGREVVVHGQPFFCGWGLTRDLMAPARRTRRLNLAELAAGTLILYPRYLDPVTRTPCPPEVLVDRLAQARARPQTRVTLLRWMRRRFETLGGATGPGVPLRPSPDGP